jgi:hypothetical protein
MDSVCQRLSAELGVPYVEMFSPWEKRRRSRFAVYPEIEVFQEVKNLMYRFLVSNLILA